MMDAIKKYIIKYRIASSYGTGNTEREHTIFSCNEQQAIHDTIQTLTYFNNGKTVEIIDCVETI